MEAGRQRKPLDWSVAETPLYQVLMPFRKLLIWEVMRWKLVGILTTTHTPA
jgi:hypothetical protein